MCTRLLAILLTLVLLLNFTGFMLADVFIARQQTAIAVRLDAQEYNDDELITVKVPMNLPYYTNHANYERVEGHVEVENIIYRYVKRRVYNDSLELLCLKDAEGGRLQNLKNKLLAHSVDKPADKQADHGQVKISFPEFFQQFPRLIAITYGSNERSFLLAGNGITADGYILHLEQPPKVWA